jgi:hypothetical protein
MSARTLPFTWLATHDGGQFGSNLCARLDLRNFPQLATELKDGIGSFRQSSARIFLQGGNKLVGGDRNGPW